MYKKILHFSIFIVFLGISIDTIAQNKGLEFTPKNNPYLISTTNGSFLPTLTNDLTINKVKSLQFKGKYFALIQFYQIPSEVQRKEWASSGLLLTDYMPHNAYFSVIDNDFPFTSVEKFVRSLLPIDKKLKMETSMFAKGITKDALNKDGLAKITLSYFQGLDENEILKDLELKSIVINDHRSYSRQIDILLEPGRIEELTNIPYVQFIGLLNDQPHIEAEDHNNSTGRTNFVNTGFGGLNYNGNGVVLAVGEGGTIDSLIDVKGRFTEMASGLPSSHKIGVTGYMAGAGNIDPVNRNNAWGATVLSTESVPNYSSLYSSHNLRFTNHSYGYSIAGAYDLGARNHDLRIASLPNHLVIYSSGNSGADVGYLPYNFTGWANITGEIKQNKNQFSIGALTPNDQLTSFSSRGPMFDGRIIPQLVIEGSGGTSNAAPKVTGIMGVLAQIYKDKTGGAEPASSLLRAILMNTADDIENPGPDFKSGYGRPNVRRSYQTIDATRYLSSSISHGNTNSHNITVPVNTKQVRVMIVWPDVAAAVNANPAIVNDLDLTLRNPSSVTFNPWVLNHTASIASISANATRGRDSINTIEQVTVDNPSSGIWTIDVKGHNVPSGPQTYFLVYEFLTDELKMAFPLADQRLVSGEQYHLRWDSYGNSGTFSLAYELNNSGTWKNIVSGYDTSARSFTWTAPNVSGGINTIKFRVKRDTITSTSGINYIGKIPENFRVFKSCNDTVFLKWSGVSSADSYKIYRLGTQFMEQVTTDIVFTGTTARLTGQTPGIKHYYAVSAVTAGNEGSRTNALEKTPGDFMCNGILWTGVVSTDWFNPGNWATGSIPASSDNVIIPAAPTNQPSIDAAGAICGRITIETGASLTMSGTTAYTLSVAGDWINNGTFTRGIGTVDFNGGVGYQEISGSAVTNFNVLKITTGLRDRIVEASSIITLNASTNPLNLVSGTFKLSSSSIITPFTNATGADITSTKGLWNNGGTISTGNFNWILNGGLIRSSAGTLNIGTNANNIINYLNNGILTIEGGAINIAGRYSPNSGISSTTYTQSGGTLTVNTIGSTSTTAAPFQINSSGIFRMSGGSIVIRNASSNAADYINLSTSSTVTDGTIQIGNSSTSLSQIIRINSTVPISNLLINTTNAPTAQLVTNGLSIQNNLTVAGGTFNTNNLDVNVGGNINNSGTITGGISLFVVNGVDTQNINGTSALIVSRLTLNNPAGIKLSGSNNLKVDNQLTFTSGRIRTLSNLLIIEDNATIVGADQNKFIDGNCRKIGDDAFTFPVGSGSVYAPISISAPAVNTDHFTVSYFPIAPHPTYDSSSVVSPIVQISKNEYWIINRTGGSSNVAVTLTWETLRSGTISSLAGLLVGRWNGTQWVSEGNASTTGSTSAGSIVSNIVTSFSPFTISSSSFALPLDLLYFSATAAQSNVKLKWEIVPNLNNAYFVIEKSKDGKTWETLSQINIKNKEEQNYNLTDFQPYKGQSYYRLKKYNLDGQIIYSKTEMVMIAEDLETSFLLYPNPASETLYILSQEKQYSFELINLKGATVLKAQNTDRINISSLPSGIYTVKFLSAQKVSVTKKISIQR